jgi:hypothetical protein
LRWANGVTGIENPGRASIEGLALIGGFSGTEGEFHAIHASQVFPYRHLSGWNWSGDFMNLDDAGAGNVNGIVGDTVWVYNCRNAYWNKAGSDNSADAHRNWNISNCREWGFKEETFLANHHSGHEIAGCGVTSYNDGVNIGASVVTYSGNRYFAIVGQEVGASTNAPSGTTDDNTWWGYISAGGAQTGIIAWVSGILVRAGGPIKSLGLNSATTWDGVYQESGEALSQISGQAIVKGGGLAVDGIWKGTVASPGAPSLTGSGTFGLKVRAPVTGGGYKGTSGTITTQLGENDATNKTIHLATDSVNFPTSYRLLFSGADILANYGGSTAWYKLTGPNTTFQGGRSAAVGTGYFVVDRLMIGPQGRQISTETAAPSTGARAQGDYAFNVSASLTNPVGWVCRAAGTPGTWEPDYMYPRANSTTGIGYVTGAGGTVTQATSKTTSVTLSKVCGQFTTFNDALGAGARATFQVTNTAIAATDTVIVNLQSGQATEGTYRYWVEKVAAGSFKLTIENLSAGSLSEALVFNFSAIKAVAA